MRDADIVAVCLVLRSLARTLPALPPVFLDLTNQAVACEGARTLAAVLQVGCGLQRLVLRQTRVSDDGAAALGAALGSSSLKELDLGECVIRDTGVRHFVRGMQVHGTPRLLTTLLLDGNPFGDTAAVELISLVEGPKRPPSLAVLSARPAMPRALSTEVEAALRVVCDLCHIELRGHAAVPDLRGGADDEVASLTSSFHGQPALQTPAQRERIGASPAGPMQTPLQDRRCQPFFPQQAIVGNFQGRDSARRSTSGSPARDSGGLAALKRRGQARAVMAQSAGLLPGVPGLPGLPQTTGTFLSWPPHP